MRHGLAFLFLALSLSVVSVSAGMKKTSPAVSPYIPTEHDMQRYREHPYTPQPLTDEQRAFLTTTNTPQRQGGTVGVSSGTMTPEALTYYCAGRAGSSLSGTVSSEQMLVFSTCFEQQKHRLRAK